MNSFPRMALFSATIVLLFDSCALDDHQPVPSIQIPDCPIQTYSVVEKSSFREGQNRDEPFQINGQDVLVGKLRSYTYQFDDQNRVIESHYIRHFASPVDRRETYEYGTDKVIHKVYDFGSSSPSLEEEIPLNAQGLWAKTGRTYDADGYLIEDTSEFGTTNYTIADGNVVRIEYRSTPGGPVSSYRTYEYDLTKPSLPNIDVTFRGKASKNLALKETNYTYSGTEPTVTSVVNFNYIDQGNGNIRRYYEFTESNVKYYALLDYAITCQPTR
ncbi:hypothetical protein [Larkinella rosea]|uniref:DUF4595 domain-containing protein n=1 Tax=Larkinella rosea TaxID=2025312 RepID=A0A3P1C3C4_9BACT|nr:hypothetical protein [Larkinella rosea]RRB07797.1 hypothetical protein EHT25_08485 [Larkinella rosea]